MIAHVGNKDVSKRINGNARGIQHFSFGCEDSVSTEPSAATYPSNSCNYSCNCIYFMNTVIFLVCDIDVLCGIDSYKTWTEKWIISAE